MDLWLQHLPSTMFSSLVKSFLSVATADPNFPYTVDSSLPAVAVGATGWMLFRGTSKVGELMMS